MPVFFSPSPSLKTHSLESCEDLATFLAECYFSFLQQRSPRFVSIAFSIQPGELLLTLRQFSHTYQHHFYFEQGGLGLLGIGKAVQLTVESRDRFAQARDLIDDLSGQILQVSTIATHSIKKRGPRPRFFCNFSFFEQHQAQANSMAQAAILLPRWQIEQQEGQAYAIVNLVLHPDFLPEVEARKIWQELENLRNGEVLAPALPPILGALEMTEIVSPQQFRDSVQKALHCIEEGQLDKIVLARALDVKASRPFDLIQSLRNLRDRYPNCYIFSATCGADQTFIGASPERLVAVQQQQLKTVALAGSAPRGHDEAEDQRFAAQLLSSDKEAHEHQFVIDFITQRLASLGMVANLETPRLLRLSNIQHRQTPIAAEIPDAVHLLDAVAALHPTPAVAGLPREIACQHIQHYENFDRSWYAAPIGWVDTEGNGEFAVGIRSAILHGNTARLFAGAGIVAGSDPERELNEVQLKLQALLKTLV